MGILQKLAAVAGRVWFRMERPDRYRCVILGITVPMAIALAVDAAQQRDSWPELATEWVQRQVMADGRQQAQSFRNGAFRSGNGGSPERAEMTIESVALNSAPIRRVSRTMLPQSWPLAGVLMAMGDVNAAVPVLAR